MNPEYYFQKGLRLIVASAVIFALIVLFSAMVSRGFPLWLALVLLVPAGLGVTGFYFFSVGSSADLSERFFRRFGCSQPRGEEKTTTEGVGSEQRCERSPDAIVPESAVVSADPVPDDRILENALATVYEYTDKDLGDAVDGTNRQILRRRLLYLACMAPVPNDVPQVRLRHDRVSYGDLCHYGWNVWNAFKGATNRFYDQTELAEWLKASFESLAKYNTKTLRAKLRATDGGYRIRLIDNLKEYFVKLVKRQLMFEEFLALKNITLQIRPGEAWGLVGTNGAGKSTMLKLISGILTPYKGTVTVNGTIAPLIELGAGFDMELTARENIFLNGTLLGHSRKFMEEHFDEIVDFAELWDFLDVPLKNYSSGMQARIGFSIATMVRPDILIVDEILAVGDFKFQEKCKERMTQMLSAGTTLLMVSHSIEDIRRMCTHAACGEVMEVTEAYVKGV